MADLKNASSYLPMRLSSETTFRVRTLLRMLTAAPGRDRGTARATLGKGLAVSAFPLYVPV